MDRGNFDLSIDYTSSWFASVASAIVQLNIAAGITKQTLLSGRVKK
jgi:hypothetical protein